MPSLGQLALQRGVAASTQNQAFSALLFLLREVLGQDTAALNSVRARRGPHLPLVLTGKEVALVLAGQDGTTGLMLRLIYGSGLRVSRCTRLRVKDLDFEMGLLTGRASKGDKDRTTLLPGCLLGPLQAHLERVKAKPPAAFGGCVFWLPNSPCLAKHAEKCSMARRISPADSGVKLFAVAMPSMAGLKGVRMSPSCRALPMRA